MAEPLVPSTSSSLSRGWTFRVLHLQNPELTLETCAPELINAVTFCPVTMMGASLDCPSRWAVRSGFKNGTAGVISHGPVHWAIFILASLSLGLGWECEGPMAALGSCCWWGMGHIPPVAPGWLNIDAGVENFVTMWPHSWHLKHWREWVSVTSCTLPITLGLWFPCSPLWLPVPSTPCSVERLWANHLARDTTTTVRV